MSLRTCCIYFKFFVSGSLVPLVDEHNSADISGVISGIGAGVHAPAGRDGQDSNLWAVHRPRGGWRPAGQDARPEGASAVSCRQ